MLPTSFHRMSRGVVLRASTILLAGSALIACGELPAENTSRITPNATPLLAVSGDRPRLRLFPKSRKYRDRGSKPARTKAGTIVVESRALLGRDGATLVEVAAGDLDSDAPPPGEIRKVKVRLPGTAAKPRTLTYNHLTGGYWSKSFRGLTRNQIVETHAHARGPERKGTTVAKSANVVQLRPDLAASDIRAPHRAVMNVPIEISAVIRELNGDVGANASCVLYIDAVRAATGDGIWVDAGGDVSCVFRVQIPTTGTKQLSVGVENVVPGDYDPRNNKATGTIVVDAGAFSFTAFALDFHESYAYGSSALTTYGPDDDGKNETLSYVFDAPIYKRHYQQGSFSGLLGVDLPFPVEEVTFSHVSNGTTIAAASYTGLVATDIFENQSIRSSCVWGFEHLANDLGSVSVSICSGANKLVGGAEVPFTTLYNARHTSQVTYFVATESLKNRVWYDNGSDVENMWAQNYNDVSAPVFTPFGSDYRLHIVLRMGGFEYVNEATIPLSPSRLVEPDIMDCRQWQEGFYNFHTCDWRRDYLRTGVSGETTGVGRLGTVPGVTRPQ
jgi:hypothetical protein